MKKVMVEFGFESRSLVWVSKKVEMEFKNEKEFVRECLLKEFGEEEECINYWDGFCSLNSIEEIVEEVINMKREDEKNGIYLGYMSGEEGFFRIVE
jgi:hypothetical protein